MKTFKGTKGEWLIDNAEPRKVYASNDSSHISISIGIERSDDENRANAKLISAAPELLDALQKLWVARNLTSVQEDLIEKAINNAL